MPNTIDAILMNTTGPVFVERQGNRIALNEGEGIYESDVIITGPETTADIVFRDGTKSRLSPDTELKLVDFDFDTEEDPSFVMDLAQGALRTVSGEVVKLNPEAFELITPRATVGIRGTEFFNSVDGDTEVHAVLYIADGHIMMVTRSDGQSINLSAPLQLIDITGDDSNPLNIHRFSLSEMEQVINVLAPTLGDNLPQSESEQGDWKNLPEAEDAAQDQEREKEQTEDANIVKTSEETNNTEGVSEEVTQTTNNIVVSVVIVDPNDPNNETLLDALADANVIVDIINAGITDENLDNSQENAVIAENDTDHNDSAHGVRPPTPPEPTPEIATRYPDTPISINKDMSSGETLSGDAKNIEISGKYIFGDNEITITGNIGEYATVSGDFIGITNPLSAGDILEFGDDTIIITGAVQQDAKVAGDLAIGEYTTNIQEINGGTFYFGDDKITIEGSVQGFVTGDTGNLTGNGKADNTFIEFGNDTIKVESLLGIDAKIYGDASVISAGDSTTFIFGNDNITVNSVTGTIYGDCSNTQKPGIGSSVTFGNDTIIVGSLSSGGKIYGDSSDPNSLGVGGTNSITVTEIDAAADTALIMGGAGIDIITVKKTITADPNGIIEINGGAGNDTIKTGAITARAGTVEIDGGDGNDAITTGIIMASGTVEIDGGDGDDIIETGVITTYYEAVTTIDGVTTAHHGTVTINGGDGNDIIKIEAITTDDGKVTINGGDGDDTIKIEAITTDYGKVTIDGGAGDDTIRIDQFTGDNIELTGGAGKDSFTIDSNGMGKLITFTDFNSQDGDITLTAEATNHTYTLNNNNLSISVTFDGEIKTFIFEGLITSGTTAQQAYDSIKDQLISFGTGTAG